jgi:chaperonin cofactor prefoldin
MHAGSRRLAGGMSRTLTKEDDPGMVEVRREDQQRINKFSACNRQMQELNGEESTLKQDLQNLQDATDELLLADDDEMVK